jgi:hypothetical protein
MWEIVLEYCFSFSAKELERANENLTLISLKLCLGTNISSKDKSDLTGFLRILAKLVSAEPSKWVNHTPGSFYTRHY